MTATVVSVRPTVGTHVTVERHKLPGDDPLTGKAGIVVPFIGAISDPFWTWVQMDKDPTGLVRLFATRSLKADDAT